MLLAKSKLNSIKVSISKALTNSSITHDRLPIPIKLVSINNMLKEYDDIK